MKGRVWPEAGGSLARAKYGKVGRAAAVVTFPRAEMHAVAARISAAVGGDVQGVFKWDIMIYMLGLMCLCDGPEG